MMLKNLILRNFIPCQFSLKKLNVTYKNTCKITSVVCNWCGTIFTVFLEWFRLIQNQGIFNSKCYTVLYLNKNIFIFGKTGTKLWSFCNLEDETALHLFANCTKSNIFWANITSFSMEI